MTYKWAKQVRGGMLLSVINFKSVSNLKDQNHEFRLLQKRLQYNEIMLHFNFIKNVQRAETGKNKMRENL